MTDQRIIDYLESIGGLLIVLSLGTDKATVEMGYHKDLNEHNRYSFTIRKYGQRKSITGYGPTPTEALADLRRREAEAARQDAITAEVERYRAKLEKEVTS